MFNPTNLPALLNETEAGKILGIKTSTLQNWRWRGDGPRFVRLGQGKGAIRYRESDLLEFIEAGLRESTSETCQHGNSKCVCKR